MNLIYILNGRMPTEKAYGIYVMKMCEALQDAGMDTVFLYPKRQNNLKEDIFRFYGVKKNFKARRLFSLDLLKLKFLGPLPYIISGASFYFSAFFYVLFNLRDYKYVLTRDFYGSSILKLLGKKVVFDIHSLPARHGFAYKFFLKLNNGFIAITEGLKKELINFGVDAEKIFVLPDGVDLEKFNMKLSKEEARKKFGFPLDKKLIMYTGHLYKWKGVYTLALASRLLEENEKTIFVGGKEYKDIPEFLKFIKENNLKNIEVLGPKPYADIPYYLASADVLILPNSGKEKLSALYTSPLKMFEYMAAGKPIVASALPSIREILNEENSVLVTPDNPQALAEGIKKVLENGGFAKKIAGEALEDVREFTWGKRAEKIIKIFKNL